MSVCCFCSINWTYLKIKHSLYYDTIFIIYYACQFVSMLKKVCIKFNLMLSSEPENIKYKYYNYMHNGD